MKMMAGKEEPSNGEAWAADGVRIGYLEQEPQLDSSKTVAQNVIDGMGGVRDMLDRFNAISEKFAEPMDDDEMNNLLTEQGELQEQIDAVDGWELERMLRSPWMHYAALRLTPPSITFQGRTAPGRPLPPLASETRNASAGRTNEPFRCRVGILA